MERVPSAALGGGATHRRIEHLYLFFGRRRRRHLPGDDGGNSAHVDNGGAFLQTF